MDYLLLVLQSVMSVFGIRAVYEQPPYEVVGRLPGGAEVRQYAPRLAAETTVAGAADRPAGSGEAFDRLAKYIFGANRSARAGKDGERIAMTAPVQAAGAGTGEKIAMTAPVQTSKGNGDKIAMTAPAQTAASGATEQGLTMRFFLPAKLTAESAPTPTDDRVRIVRVPAETVAVLRFSGSWGERGIDVKKAALLKALDGAAWRPAGEPYTLFYDPPFTIPLLRRNEVAVAVEPRPK